MFVVQFLKLIFKVSFLQNVLIGMDIPVFDNRRTVDEYDILYIGSDDEFLLSDDNVEVSSCKIIELQNIIYFCLGIKETEGYFSILSFFFFLDNGSPFPLLSLCCTLSE